MHLGAIFMASTFEYFAIKGNRRATEQAVKPSVYGMINGFSINGL